MPLSRNPSAADLVTVGDCQRVQINWYAALAAEESGREWANHGLHWIWRPTVNELVLMFPETIRADALRRGIGQGRLLGAKSIGAWLSDGTDALPLAEAGFQRGWEPWWMTASLDCLPDPDDERVALDVDVPGYETTELLLARTRPDCCWHASARIDGRFAGTACSFLDRELAGVFDMAVWPRYRRRGLGRALLLSVCHAARQAGATAAVLNATAEGKLLYEQCGFRQIGAGITWWLHLDR